MFTVESRPRVAVDIENAVEYYYQINPLLALQFLDRIEEAKQIIINTIEGFEVKYKTVRTVLLKQFPFHIHYIISKEQQKIIILAVLPAKADPQKWKYL